MEKELIKIDRNGSKHFKGLCTCDRCNGTGVFYIGVHNGKLIPASPDGGTCYKCHGKGKILSTWIERTPEYQAKLDARKEAKNAAMREKMEENARIKREKEEAEKEAREKAEKERKANLQYIGNIGDRLKKIPVTYVFGTTFNSFYGIVTLLKFIDGNGNVLIWKTNSCPEVLDENGKDVVIDTGDKLYITGTIKEHNEYKEEKQTILTRCKLTV